jgi:large subunit ribosomal protein L21
MIAVVQIGGEQIRVEKGKTFTVNRLNEESGKKISFKDVLLIEDKGSVQLGSPKIEKATVSASILEHFKGEKVIVFKKKRRKGYKVKNGHRQYLTKIKIDDISLDKKKVTTKKESAKSTASKATKTKSSSSEKKEISKPKAK